MTKSHFYYLILFALLLTACGTIVSPTPIANKTKIPPFLTREEAIQAYEAEFSNHVSYTWNGNVSNCFGGTLPQNVLNRVLQRVNFYRKLVGLPTNCFFEASQNANAQEAALMMRANNTLDHNPPSSWKCYSQAGALGANCCLAYYGVEVKPEIFIGQWIQDAGSNNTAVGHRVNIFTEQDDIMFGFGTNSTYAALCRDWRSGTMPDSLLSYIAYPPNGHIVSELVYPRWSFMISGADLSTADISMKDANGAIVPANQQIYDPAFRALVWEPTIANNITADTKFTVEITGAKVGIETKSYTYDVILVKR